MRSRAARKRAYSPANGEKDCESLQGRMRVTIVGGG